ncbi:MAG: aminotransferase class V-fold PLP-dependent enzyme [Ignavibacteriales bacterium]|nr:aminotransferase class V-fold PLP-dependent enzyme [Ignavibacteriales bacterium]
MLILADSAHGIGMLDLDMKALGIDVFASSPYKWLGRADGVGLLYVRKEALEQGPADRRQLGLGDGRRRPPSSTRRGSGRTPCSSPSTRPSNFNSRIGKSRIERRIKALAARLKQELAKSPGGQGPHPRRPLPQRRADGLLHGRRPRGPKLVDFLREKYNLVVRTTGNPRPGPSASGSRRRSTSRRRKSTWSSRGSGRSIGRKA